MFTRSGPVQLRSRPNITLQAIPYAGGGYGTMNGSFNECVELAGSLDAVRDSKNLDGPIQRADLRDLLTAIREERFTSR